MIDMLNIQITSSLIEEMINYSGKCFPNETCVFLLGKINKNNFIVDNKMIPELEEKSPVYFRLSPEETLKTYEYAIKQGKEIVGIFHSHPYNMAYPSETDRRHMEMNKVIWMIYSNKYNQLNAYFLEEDIKQVLILEKTNEAMSCM